MSTSGLKKNNDVSSAKQLHKINKKMRLYYAKHYESKPIDNHLILYETRDGNSIVDSPFAMFLELASNEEYSHLKHVWIINSEVDKIETCIPDHLRHKVTFVERGTIDYVEVILKAKYLISNATFDTFFTKRPGQVYINTWHGTPLKFMGFDIPGLLNHSQNVIRNFLMTDYILSPNKHTTDIFLNSYHLDGIYPGKILEGGYPRIDETIDSDSHLIKERIRYFGTKVGEKPIILFCPTWKGQSIQDTDDDVEQIANETLAIVDKFKEQYDVLLKVHPYVYNSMKEDPRVSNYLISDLVDPNQLLSIVAILITDYSSIFFDFLVTKKPIIFYSWDRDLYEESRGMYLDEAELPGPIVENLDELLETIESIKLISKSYDKTYDQLREKMVPYEDGHVTKRYIDYIFKNKKSEKITEYLVDSNKTKLLIYPGGMIKNGITNSFLNLVNNIDYDKYDVTVMVNSNRNQEGNDNLRLLNKNVRILFRFGISILTKNELKIDKVFNVDGLPKEKRDKYPAIGYKREMNRLTANLNFDVAIDFSGYSYFWGRHILSANAKKYVAFMHNDLVADSGRIINGKQPMKKDLEALFTIYYKFNKLLSVSPMTRDVNLEKLKGFVVPEQMSYVYNSINIEEILDKDRNGKQDDQESSVIVERRLMSVIDKSLVDSFKNLSHLKSQTSEKVSLKTRDDVVEHASIIFNDSSYSKVSINGKYIGWIETKYFKAKPYEIIECKKFHAIATVSRGQGYSIWKNMRTGTEDDVALTSVDYFMNRYLEIRQVALTSNGKFYHVFYNKQELGWVSSFPLLRLHKIFPYGVLSAYFKFRMKHQEKLQPVIYPTKVERTQKYATLKKEKTTTLWSLPSNTANSIELPITQEYFKEPFIVNQLVYFNDKVYCKLSFSDDRVAGFVEQEMIDFISLDQYNFFIKELENKESIIDSLPKVDLSMQKVPAFDSSYFNLVNMGRLSPEKNQKNLIAAFSKFNHTVPKSRLYILGKGPLANELVEYIRELKLEGKVILLGHMSKPFNFIRLNDYFVLPSFYEGQPMVLLESLTIKMNILASNIPANINVIGKNEEYGLLTAGTSEQNIYDGMIRAYNHPNSFEEFDYENYNKKAMETFYREIN